VRVLSVTFEVPERIRAGLGSGDLVRRGGVIQWAKGPSKGQIASWLRETGGLGELAPAQISPVVAEQLSQLQFASSALAVGQVLHLGVSVMGFAVLHQKLRVLDAKLDTVLVRLRDAEEDMAWLDRRLDMSIAAELRGALEAAELPSLALSPESQIGLYSTCSGARHHYEQLMVAMLKNERAHKHPELFSLYLAGLSLASVARGRLLRRLEGAAFASQNLHADQQGCSELLAAFQSPLLPQADGAPRVFLSPRLHAGVKRALPTLREIEGRLFTHASELRFQVANDLSAEEWEALGQREEPGLALILPS
jgi:hypothetical protein